MSFLGLRLRAQQLRDLVAIGEARSTRAHPSSLQVAQRHVRGVLAQARVHRVRLLATRPRDGDQPPLDALVVRPLRRPAASKRALLQEHDQRLLLLLLHVRRVRGGGGGARHRPRAGGGDLIPGGTRRRGRRVGGRRQGQGIRRGIWIWIRRREVRAVRAVRRVEARRPRDADGAREGQAGRRREGGGGGEGGGESRRRRLGGRRRRVFVRLRDAQRGEDRRYDRLDDRRVHQRRRRQGGGAVRQGDSKGGQGFRRGDYVVRVQAGVARRRPLPGEGARPRHRAPRRDGPRLRRPRRGHLHRVGRAGDGVGRHRDRRADGAEAPRRHDRAAGVGERVGRGVHQDLRAGDRGRAVPPRVRRRGV
mmetsp:Transcript_3816/g.13154  ORF Transcript_3816/g.13154 Transcript_3816/m.13154 type:complete len:363 (-) Transcript_3816:344-1432(-)